MSFDRPTLTAQIGQAQSDINGRLTGADSRLRRSVLTVLARVLGGFSHGLFGYAESMAKEMLPDTADAWLTRHAAIWGLSPRPATKYRRTATATGNEDAVIEANSILRRSDGAEFKVLADVTLGEDGATLSFEALVAGSAGITAAGSELTFTSPIAGVDSTVTVLAGGASGGADEETPAALKARLLARIRQQPQGGSRSDYEGWALEVEEVTGAWVYPQWSGAGTVGLTFIMGDREDIIPTEDDVEAVQAYIDVRRPVTADLIVFAPIGDELDLEIEVTPDTSEVRAAVAAELADLLSRVGTPGGTILLSQLNEAISLAAGETDHVLVSPSANVTHAAGHIPVLGTIDWGD